MEKITLIMSSVLPVPATKGGAVENLLENIVKFQEFRNEIDLNIISAYDYEAYTKSRKYPHTNFTFVKLSKLSKCIDKIILFIASKILKKDNLMAYSFICQRMEYYRKISKIIANDDYGKLVFENSAGLYLCLKWKKNYKKYMGKYYYHCHNAVRMNFGCEKIIRDTKKFIGVSDYILSDLSENLGEYVKESSVVLRNCVEESRFGKNISVDEAKQLRKKYNIKENDRVILFTGRLTKEKGILELLEAIKKCKTENIKLIVVGSFFFDTNVQSEFEKKLKEYKDELKDKLVFTGFVEYENIYKIYKISNLAVLPSIWNDPAPLTIIESLTCGLPIITTNSGGIPEYATGGSAIIIKRDENIINNLSFEIDNLLNDDRRMKYMSKKSLEVSKELTLENYYNNFKKIMEE